MHASMLNSTRGRSNVLNECRTCASPTTNTKQEPGRRSLRYEIFLAAKPKRPDVGCFQNNRKTVIRLIPGNVFRQLCSLAEIPSNRIRFQSQGRSEFDTYVSGLPCRVAPRFRRWRS